MGFQTNEQIGKNIYKKLLISYITHNYKVFPQKSTIYVFVNRFIFDFLQETQFVTFVYNYKTLLFCSLIMS